MPFSETGSGHPEQDRCHSLEMGASRIFHIAEQARWERAVTDGSYVCSTRDARLSEVGFIHCSFEHQVETVANFLYGDWNGPLLLLEVDADEIPSEVRVENLEGGVEGFPHIYGPLPTAAVKAVHRLVRQATGWTLPANI